MLYTWKDIWVTKSGHRVWANEGLSGTENLTFSLDGPRLGVLPDCHLTRQAVPRACPVRGEGGKQCPPSQLPGQTHVTASPPSPQTPQHPLQLCVWDCLSCMHGLRSLPSSPTHVMSLFKSVMSILSRNQPGLLPELSWRIRIFIRAPRSMA